MNREEYLQCIRENAPYVNLERVERAFDYGAAVHEGQTRKSGEPYFTHPAAVSGILAELRMDEDTIIAGLLHDTVEDTNATPEIVDELFGSDVERLVRGVTKLELFTYQSQMEYQVENLRKMFIAMANDFRVIVIKLADRLHNMRTLNAMPPEKQQRIAKETIDIYAPIAGRLGIFRIKWELEDLSLKYLDPVEYQDLTNKVNKKLSERREIIEAYIDQIRKALNEVGIECEIYGRPKNLYSIYRKMKYQDKQFDEIYDLTAIRVILDDEKKLYGALGEIHSLWNFIPGRFKDYVSNPKANHYRSLHTTLMGKNGPFEVQLRTREMHEQAEYGIAAHWKYKEGNTSVRLDDLDAQMQSFRQMLELQSDLSEPGEFMDSLQSDILSAEVFVFTPNGKSIVLPDGATPIDFAYRIHSEVGNSAIAAKVNGRIVPLSYHLSNGQMVEILTQKNGPGPSRDWLKFVKSTQAKQKIRQWFKKERREENIEKGEEIIVAELKRHGLFSKSVLNENFLEPILRRLSLKTLDDLYNAIGYGGILTAQVIPKIREKVAAEEKEKAALEQAASGASSSDESKRRPPREEKYRSTGVIVKGMDDILVRFAKCCTPVPGDSIIGYITRGRGVTIHRADCENFEKNEETENRFIEATWACEEKGAYYASVMITALNRKGVMSDITAVVGALDMDFTSLNAKVDKNNLVTISLSVEIQGVEELDRLFRKLKGIQDIIEIKRVSA
ncbi:MAG: bifunctional (p)ppGpp synthetase/guanosine-3',5'-bis(diphosphate) 3'-pyrophosphohydrolase [Bacillota bacterium]|nr:bifunctional (p)ppGpp synthetase/guanosine-3',5'-bis(diphosphate) 3'-pyrophosphohydrolase [Bacillota bacterium]